jgi:RimJ/RimL family protein N-acetyltransferase
MTLMLEVRNTDACNLRQLFNHYHYQVAVSSVLDGRLQGIVYVDDMKEPKTGLMMTTEGTFLAGYPANEEFNADLSEYLEGIIQTGRHPIVPKTDDLWFYIDSDEWKTSFPQIFTSRDPFKVRRIHYSCIKPAYDWRKNIEEGYVMRRADRTLDTNSLYYPKDVWEWVGDRLDELLERGFGAVLTKGDEVISWSNADCASGERCEIGIITTEKERRKGFGSLTASAALDFCFRLGFKEVGWHCEAHNWGSMATANKIGFKKKTDYYMWICKFDLEQHLKEKPIVEKYYP